MNVIDKIRQSAIEKHTLLCCGLDPDPRKYPLEYQGMAPLDATRAFLSEVVELTNEHVWGYKLQKAFFDVFEDGHRLMRDVITCIRGKDPSLTVIIDGKFGDIDNTMKAYCSLLFDDLRADAAVLNPYMGDDVWAPLRERQDRAGFVLVRTSNESGKRIQDVLLKDGRPLWEYLLSMLAEEWKKYRNIIPIVSATTGDGAAGVRSTITSDMLVYVAGIGAQGGNMKTLRELQLDDGIGAVTGSSRSLVYPYFADDRSWRDSIEAATRTLKNELNSV